MRIKKSWLVLVIIILLALIGGGIWLGLNMKSDSQEKVSKYSVVLMEGGDVYFGVLSKFGGWKLSNAWILQRATDKDGRVQTTLVPVTKAIWEQTRDLYINEEKVISWARLKAETEIVKALDSPEKFEQVGGQGQITPGQPTSQSAPAVPEAEKNSKTNP